jgi:hypothetical protein
MSAHRRVWLGSLICGLLTLPAAPVAAQSGLGPLRVHINGLTGVIGLADNIDQFYSSMNKIIEETGDGLDDVFDAPDRKKAKGGSASLERLRPGTEVVVHYAVKGIQASPDAITASSLNAGVVTNVDRSRKQITIAFTNGESETLRMKHSATHGGRVIVYSVDDSGRKVTHYFEPASN